VPDVNTKVSTTCALEQVLQVLSHLAQALLQSDSLLVTIYCSTNDAVQQTGQAEASCLSQSAAIMLLLLLLLLLRCSIYVKPPSTPPNRCN
jgi:hypothetical protein